MSTPAAGQAATPLGETFHNGVNQGGNKSFCSYRLGVGVPGYTGFVPVPENLDIPTKTGCAKRAPTLRGDIAHGDGGTIMKPDSSFKIDFTLTPADFARGTMPNPLYDVNAKMPVGDPPFIRRPVDDMDRRFCGGSTFKDSYDAGLQDHPQDYPLNVTRTGMLRPKYAAAAAVGADASPFYTTEYMQKSEEGNLNMAIKKVLPPGPAPAVRVNRQLTGVALKNPRLSTSYRDAFGKFGVDPRSNWPEVPTPGINFNASTAENYQGTTKASYHPPGYSGFIPETGRNAHATNQAIAPKAREGTKNFELQTLFQYPQQLPGYGGYRPQTAINDVGPIRNELLTTTGRVMQSGSCGFVPGDLGLSMKTLAPTAPQRSVFGKSGSMVGEAFSHESLTGMLSENGRFEAEAYYKTVRPMEGRSVAIIKQGHWNQLY